MSGTGTGDGDVRGGSVGKDSYTSGGVGVRRWETRVQCDTEEAPTPPEGPEPPLPTPTPDPASEPPGSDDDGDDVDDEVPVPVPDPTVDDPDFVLLVGQVWE